MRTPHAPIAAVRAPLLCALLGTLLTLAACTRGERGEQPPVRVSDTAPAPSPASTAPATPPSAPARSSESSALAEPAASEEFLARCREAAAYSRANDGEVLLVLLHGTPVFEDTAPGFTVQSPHLLASGTKSFCGVAAMCAVADGLLSLDEPVSATIHEWRNDPRKAGVTIRQLLTLSSGLEGLSSTIDSRANAREAGVTDRAKASVAARSLADPGERFIYGPSSFYVFGELLKRKLAAAKTGDADLEAYLDRRIFTPIGIHPSFTRDEAGNANFAGGCRLNAAEWARFGEFLRNGGTHEGKSLLAPELVAEMLRATGPNQRYGLTWWLLVPGAGNEEDDVADGLLADRLEARDGPIGRRLAQRLRERAQGRANGNTGDAASETRAPTTASGKGSHAETDGGPATAIGYSAAGKGKQRLLILPEHGLTIVRFGPLTGSAGFENEQFLQLLLGPDAER
ncbi:MAG: beta-lactamase family protein [Planctomycetaceae bacterium]|nr:beta-lactamase family protein [Planctomycetaceae bacterium]